MKKFLTILLLFLYLQSSCQNTVETSVDKIQNIETYISEMIKNHFIPGMAVAIIKDNSVIHRGFYGVEDLETKSAITDETIFKVYSLTKTFVATSIFKLIEENKLALNDPLSLHFDDLPVKWQDVTIGNLLSHSSGLPDILDLTKEHEDDNVTDEELRILLYKEEMQFPTNHQWRYNQTNYLILETLIEQKANSQFETFVLDSQFPKAIEDKVFFSTGKAESINNQATYYQFNRETESFGIKDEHLGKKNHPLAGLHLTLDEYIRWNKGLDNNEHISEDTKLSMWSPFNFTDSDRKFLYGWDVYGEDGLESCGFSGGGVSGFRKFINKNLTIIVLTTGFKNYSVHNLMIDHIAGIVDTTLYNEVAALSEQVMGSYFLLPSAKNYETIIEQVKKEHPENDLEEVFRSIGFTLFFQLDRKEDAINLFKLNTLENSDSFDAYGSLAYLYLLTEQYEVARKNYVKAMELNPENGYSQRRINEIDLILKENKE